MKKSKKVKFSINLNLINIYINFKYVVREKNEIKIFKREYN